MTQEEGILHFGEEWAKKLTPLLVSDHMKWIESTLHQEYLTKRVSPGWSKVFAAFRSVPPAKLKVVILGDRPYKTGLATGIAFAIPDHQITDSKTLNQMIRNIENNGAELSLDFDYSLEHWAKQGVLMLNSALTVSHVEEYNPHIHIWFKFITYFIKYLSINHPHVVILSIGHGYGLSKELFDTMNIIHVNRDKFTANGPNLFGKVNDILDGQNGRDNIIYWDKRKNQIFDAPF